MAYCDTTEYKERYCYAVTYMEGGVKCSDTWTAQTLARELLAGEVLILEVEHRSLWDTED